MKDIGLFRTYSINPDPHAPGDHVTKITLVIKSGPGALPDLARSIVPGRVVISTGGIIGE